LESVGGLQTQYAPSGYVGLWSRLAGFERNALTQALETRAVIQGTLMRTTIHTGSAREYWLYAVGTYRARREWWLRVQRGRLTEDDLARQADTVRRALADGPRSVKELGELARGFIGSLGVVIDLVRVPPSGTWERRRADLLGLAEDWVGPVDATEEEGLDHLVRAYLRGFGPAPLRDIASWAGVPVTMLKPAVERLDLVRYRDENATILLDLPGSRVSDAETPAPVRFLPPFDANLLAHARRTGILPEEYRPRVMNIHLPFVPGVFLVDGVGAGTWAYREGRIVLEAFDELSDETWREVRDEAQRLEAFHADQPVPTMRTSSAKPSSVPAHRRRSSSTPRRRRV
jgi:hypothetical protein